MYAQKGYLLPYSTDRSVSWGKRAREVTAHKVYYLLAGPDRAGLHVMTGPYVGRLVGPVVACGLATAADDKLHNCTQVYPRAAMLTPDHTRRKKPKLRARVFGELVLHQSLPRPQLPPQEVRWAMLQG